MLWKHICVPRRTKQDPDVLAFVECQACWVWAWPRSLFKKSKKAKNAVETTDCLVVCGAWWIIHIQRGRQALHSPADSAGKCTCALVLWPWVKTMFHLWCSKKMHLLACALTLSKNNVSSLMCSCWACPIRAGIVLEMHLNALSLILPQDIREFSLPSQRCFIIATLFSACITICCDAWVNGRWRSCCLGGLSRTVVSSACSNV